MKHKNLENTKYFRENSEKLYTLVFRYEESEKVVENTL